MQKRIGAEKAWKWLCLLLFLAFSCFFLGILFTTFILNRLISNSRKSLFSSIHIDFIKNVVIIFIIATFLFIFYKNFSKNSESLIFQYLAVFLGNKLYG